MNARFLVLVAALAFVAGWKTGWKSEQKEPAEMPAVAADAKAEAPAAQPVPTVELDANLLALFGKLPPTIDRKEGPASKALVDLGRMLYYDPRLSQNHDVSCNTCHDLAAYGVDGKPTSAGHRGLLGARNSPTVYNAAGRHVQFWDGRAVDVEEQALGPILNPVEMGMPDESRAVTTVASMPGYVEAFAKAFPDEQEPITFINIGRAIGAFERGLVTPSPWDRYLDGDKTALSAEQKAGFTTFVKTGCTMCHSGSYVGGTMFQKLGLVKQWPSDKDLGRYAVTKNEADKFMFSVPSLRNVAETAPYYHDGSIATLELAVKKMAEYQLGRDLSDEDTRSIIAWLGSLTGEIPSAYIAKPTLPESSATTPKPES